MAGRKVFLGRDVLAADDVNEFLMDQAVMGFASASARGTAIPAPTEGMISTLDDTEGLYRYDGTRWRKIAGPPELVVSVESGAASGAINSGAVGAAVSVAVPAHHAGTLRIRFHGSWISAANAAASTRLHWHTTAATIGGINVPGSFDRQHNNNVLSPQKIVSEGYVASDGTAKVATLVVSPDAAGAAVTVNSNNWEVWLL